MKKNIVKINEAQLKKIVAESVKKVLKEGYYQPYYNSEGEPMGQEYIRDAQEEDEAYWEEMDRRASDSMYAASQESEYWYNQALAAFEDRGVKVPNQVISILAKELRKKQQEEREKEEIAEAKPYIDFIEKLGYKVRARYIPETPQEMGYLEIIVSDDKGEIGRKDYDKIVQASSQSNLPGYIDDYLSYNEYRKD